MTVLITGATGLIGTGLTQLLLEEGHTVHYLTTRESKVINKPNHKGFLWNIKQQTIDKDCIQGVTHIIHLVGATIAKPWTKSYRQEIFDSRIKSIELLKDLIKSEPNEVAYFMSASGVSIYPHSFTQKYDEASTGIDDSFLAQVVVAWEAAARTVEDLGIKVSFIRTGVVFSKTEGALQKIAQPIRMGAGAALGSGKQWISWIHVADICGLYFHLLKANAEGIINAVAPEPATNSDLTKAVAKILKKPLWLPKVPAAVLKMALGDRSSLVLEGQYVQTNRTEVKDYTFKYPQLIPALEDLLG